MGALNFILKFGFNFLYWLDLGLNWILLGDPSETVSSRLGRALKSGKPKWFVIPFAWFVDRIFYRLIGEKNHSVMNIELDEDYELELWNWIKK